MPQTILKKLCEKDPSNWDKYINQVLASYRVTPNLATAENSILLSLWKRPQLTSTPASRAHAMIPRRSRILITQLGGTHLALAIAKKTLDKNCFRTRTAQKTKIRETSSFKIGDRVYFKNKQSREWDS